MQAAVVSSQTAEHCGASYAGDYPLLSAVCGADCAGHSIPAGAHQGANGRQVAALQHPAGEEQCSCRVPHRCGAGSHPLSIHALGVSPAAGHKVPGVLDGSLNLGALHGGRLGWAPPFGRLTWGALVSSTAAAALAAFSSYRYNQLGMEPDCVALARQAAASTFNDDT